MSEHAPNLGFEYEVHLPAYFALVLNNNPDIEDFNLRSNVEGFGNLDDLLVEIRKKNGEELRFAFQLKHKKDGLLPSNSKAKRDFNIEKYYFAFKELTDKNKNYNFILFTNKRFPASRKKVTNFKMKVDDRCPGRTFFDTSQDGRALYKFEVSDKTKYGKCGTKEDYREFFSKFTLYSRQVSFNDLDRNLLDHFKFKEPCLKYIDFFRRWHREEFSNKIVDKKTLNIQLIDIFLAPFIMVSFQLPFKNFEQAVKEFDVTVLEDLSSDSFLQTEEEEVVEEDRFIQLAKEWKIINTSTKQIDKSIKMKLLYYIFEKPLIVTVTETSKNLIYKAMEMFRMDENKIRFVFVGQQIDNEKFGSLRILKNLQNLSTVNPCLYEEIINECVLSFQGRTKISFKKLIDDYGNIATLTSPTDLLQILHQDYSVGGKKETLPSYYMPRSISIKIQKLQLVLDRCIETKELIIIFIKEFQNFTCLLPRQKVTFLSVKNFNDRRYITASTIVLTTDEHLSSNSFDKICNTYYKKCKKLFSKKDGNKKPAAYYFMLLNKEDLLLVMSSNKVSRSSISNLEKLSVNESAIDTYLRNPINILVSGAGMGKSTFFKKLKNDCFLDRWTFYMDLKIHTDFLKKRPNGVDVLNYLKELEESANPDSFTKKILTVFLEEKKMVIFLDGVDEIDSDSLKIVLDFTQELCLMGYHIWLASRQNLKKRLEEKFNIFAVDIEELNQNDQKMFIRDRLKLKYRPEEIEKIIVNIFRNFDITNNFQILGIPLQLFIITDILINDRRNFQHDDNIFVLTKMYRMFIEGRYRHVIEKTNSQNSHLLPLDIEDLLEKYALLALHSLFPKDILWALLSFDTRKITRILTKIKNEKDSLGIVLEVNSEGKAVFEHVTFAEYFVCTFLANNYTEVEILKYYLFSEEYENLLRMLNIMLAEDSKLHLAVIYKDLDQIKTLLEDKDNSPWCVDKGGRNLLHILSCISTRYPHLNFTKDGEYIEIDDLAVKDFERESSVIMEILTLLLDLDVNWFKNDNIFVWDPLSYAVNFGALYIVEALCERYTYITFVHFFDKILYFLYYSLKFGYPNLLKKVFSNEVYLNVLCKFDKITCKSLSDDESHSVIRLVVQTACDKQNEILDILNRSLEVVAENPEFCSVVINASPTSLLVSSRSFTRQSRVLEPQNYVQQVISTSSPRNPTISLQKFRSKWLPSRMRTDSKLLFYYAALEGNVEIISTLLSKKSKRSIKHYALFPAIENNQVAAVTLLLNTGASINCIAGPLGETALHLATRLGNVAIAQMLLERGAKLETKRGNNGLNVLNSAIFENQKKVINVLLERGAKYDHQSLFAAAFAGNLQLLKHLVKKIEKINERNELGEHVLQYIFKNNDVNVDVVDFLLANGASVEERGRHGWTILHHAVMSGQVEIVELLLKKYNLVKFLYVVDEEGATPLQLAVQQGDVEIVEKILEQDINFEKIKFNKKIMSLYKAKHCLTSDLLLQVTTEIRDMLD